MTNNCTADGVYPGFPPEFVDANLFQYQHCNFTLSIRVLEYETL